MYIILTDPQQLNTISSELLFCVVLVFTYFFFEFNLCLVVSFENTFII